MSKRLHWTVHICRSIIKKGMVEKLNEKTSQQNNDRPTEYSHNKNSYQSTQNN